ncbi:hypothetical protein ACTXM3_17565 [Glutamicibacter arilaitensis]|uniref:hypothetical protein n=1 Tax=Glutamicibacter arilaitensis TaxID=256701 RepID=UPI003FD5A315
MSDVYGLGERGQEIFDALSTGEIARDALVLEAARTADRLNDLDSIIQGKGVLELMVFRLDFPEGEDEPFSVEVKFQNVLSEARQQQTAFATLIDKIARFGLTAKASKGGEPAPVPANVTALDAIRAKVNLKSG